MDKHDSLYNAIIYIPDICKDVVTYKNLLDIPVDQYLNVSKVVMPMKNENLNNLDTCLKFICENLKNLRKLRFVMNGGINKVIPNRNFLANIMTNKIALLQNLRHIKISDENKNNSKINFYDSSRFRTTLIQKRNLAYIYENNMIIFDSEDSLVVPCNITKLNIALSGNYSQKMLTALPIGLEKLNLTIYKDKINLLNSINLPPTMTNFNIKIYIPEHPWMYIYTPAFEDHIFECSKTRRETEKIIKKIPHGCELNITVDSLKYKPLLENERLTENKSITEFIALELFVRDEK